MKKLLTGIFAVSLLFSLSSFSGSKPTVATGPKSEATATVRVKPKFINSDGTEFSGGADAFWLYAYNTVTGEYYDFDYESNSFYVPAGTYVFAGTDASGAGNIGANSGPVAVGNTRTASRITTVVLYVWAE